MKKVFFIGDMHMPYHDKKVWKIILECIKDFKPDEIVIIGDFADCYSVSSHAKDPDGERNLENELKPVRLELEKLRGLDKKAKIVYLEGNHCNRYTRYIRDRAPELSGVSSVPKILELDKLNIKWIPYGKDQLYQVAGSTLYARHEPYSSSPAATLARGKISIVTGHNHKISHWTSTAASGKTFRHISCGHGANVHHQVMNYNQNPVDWQHGFATAYILNNRNFLSNVYEIMDGQTVFEGKLYR